MSNKPKQLKKTKKDQKLSYNKDSMIYNKPVWNGNDVFTINGYQLQYLTEIMSIFKPIIQMTEEVLTTGELAGTVKSSFVYNDGTPVPESDPRLKAHVEEKEKEIAEMRAQIEEYKKQMEEKNAAITAEMQKAGAKTKEEVVEELNATLKEGVEASSTSAES